MSTFRILLRYFSAQKALLTWYVLLAVIHGFMMLPIPLILRFIIDHVSAAQWGSIVIALGLLLLVSVADIALAATSRFGIVRVVKKGIQALQQELLRLIITSPHKAAWAEYEDGLKDVIVNDTFRLDLAVTIGLSQVLPALISIIVLLVVLFILSPVLFLISCGFFPACIVILFYSRKKVAGLQDRFRRAMLLFEERVGFTIRAWELVKMQTAEHQEIAAHDEIGMEVRQSGDQLARQQTILQLSQEGMGLVFGVMLLGVGFFLSSFGMLTISQVISFFVGFSLLRSQLVIVFTGWPHVVMLHDALLRTEQVLTISQETPYSGTSSHEITGEISLRNVALSVGGAAILRDATAVFKAGTLSVIEGKNGAGKTTLLLALLGLLVPDKGNIMVDGMQLEVLDIAEYRKHVAVVSQEAIFLNASVEENERYGLDDMYTAGVSNTDFFTDGPRNISSLSGGEKQRLMISRALKRRPKILFLDEVTNHLDAAYRKALYSQLRALLPTTTIICITHDPDLIAIADARYRIVDSHVVSF